MSLKTLFDLGFAHWPALLLSFLPALITLAAMIYTWLKFPPYKINKIYLLFLLSIFTWQLNDSFGRMSHSEETARGWDRLLSLGWMMQFPTGIHWALLLIGEKKLSESSWFLILIYFLAFFFSILLCGGLYSQSFTYSSFLGWVKSFNTTHSFQLVPLIWVCLSVAATIILLGYFAYQNRKSPDAKFVSLLIFIGYA